ncbi:PLP-dependent aminotransferase family protein [Bradyrhizobium sp. SSUT18]|uniref:MocR-like pyridoxine biosynthesis transcription factor PdxR n=1 Tax=Bradyrhizobium sp. SSUT18 TaxID=3040602 RepID=UPI00244C2F30|nr:PLP-dependent aminotransferase family protein [Bradyrhizobium sp. SSUT18]MDH2399949.1 PLP-dependent aminotransferase family protein [Bradyrhizobium sp. SSUT18]
MQHSSRLQFTGYQLRYREVYQRLRDSILQGAYPHGARVPSIRTLASELGLSRATIEKAYDLLIGEGLLVSHGQSGTRVSYVRPRMPVARIPYAPDQSIPDSKPTGDDSTDVSENERSGTLAGNTGVSPFQISVPAIDVFPRAAWLKISQRILRDRAEISQLVDDVQGYHALRTAICGYLNVARGIRCGPHQIFITGGYRQSLSLVAGALVASESAIWIEDPGYPPTSVVLERLGMRPIPIPVDSEGLDVNEGRQRAARARMAITTPTKQSPLGVSMSLRRRSDLTDWAAETGAWIVEDDYDNEFCFEGKHLPTLHNLDTYGRTLYFGTFSKNLHPNLRIAYVVSPDSIVAPLRIAANNMLDGISILQQKVLAAFIAEGHFALHLKKSRGICAARRKMVIDALAARFGPRLSICQKSCGLHLFATTSGSTNDVAICKLANQKGLGLSNLSSRYIKAEPKQGLLLGYANFSSDALLSRSIDPLEECLDHFDHVGAEL